MKISIVIATYNRQPTLARTLRTILDQDFAADQREVIVVNDGSTDATADYLRTVNSSCRLEILEAPHRGPAAARNAGILAAGGELILLLDDDMLCGRDLVSGHVAAHRQAQSIVAFGPIGLAAESGDSIALRWLNSHRDRNTAGTGQAPASKYQAWATNCSVKRSVLIAQGGYDERLLTHEDADLGIRLWEAGVRFQFDPALAISELYDKPPWRLAGLETRRLGQDEVVLCRKHPGYRPHSRQAHLRKHTLGSLLIWLACRFPVSPQPLLKPLQLLAGHLRPKRQAEALAMQLFSWRMAIEEVRGSLEESGSWQAFHQRFGLDLRVLGYGLASSDRAGGDRKSTISAARFERQLLWLRRRGYSHISASQWRAWIENDAELPAKPVLITLDNSYAWLAEHAIAILHHNGAKAIAFTTGAEDEGSAGTDLVGADLGREDLGREDLMTAEQMRRWSEAGMEFGVRLPAYVSGLGAAEMRQELIRRKNNLENTLGSPVSSFTYPGGVYDSVLRNCAEGVFEIAFTGEAGLNALHTDLLRVRTIAVSLDDYLAAFASRVILGRRPTQILRPRQKHAANSVVEQSRVVRRAGQFAPASTREAAVSPRA